MRVIDNTLNYLRESLANHRGDEMIKQISEKMDRNHFKNEEEFVRALKEEEIDHLDQIVRQELDYARGAEDDVRARQLREVYELLF